jgi:hypothetical protein
VGAIVIVVAINISEAAGSDPPSVADVRELLHVNGVDRFVETTAPIVGQQLILIFHQQNPNLSQRADAIIMEVVAAYMREKAEHDHIIEQFIPIYSKYFSGTEIRQLTTFYQTPIGKKLVIVTPAIELESSSVGRAWAQFILPGLEAQIQSRLESENL